MELSTGLLQIRGIFDDSLTQAAQRLAQSGAVSNVRVLQAGTVVTGIAVAEPDSAVPHSHAHRVYIQHRPAGMHSECSCGERSPCIHVAAVLIVAEQGACRISAEDRRPGIEGVWPQPQPTEKNAHDLPAQRQRLYYRVDVAGAGTDGGFRIGVSVGHAAAGGGRAGPRERVSFHAADRGGSATRRYSAPLHR